MTQRPVRAFFQNQMEQAVIRVRQVVKLNTVYAFRCTHVDRESFEIFMAEHSFQADRFTVFSVQALSFGFCFYAG